MPIFKKGNRSVFFAHIPKTGGTSVERMFKDAGWKTTRLGNPGTQNQHAPASRYEQWNDLPEEKFVIIRHPVDRFVSELKYRGRPHTATAGWLNQVKKSPSMQDNHLRPQVEFLVPGMTLYIFEEGAINQIAEDYDLKPLHLNARANKVTLPESTRRLIEEHYKEDMVMYESYKND